MPPTLHIDPASIDMTRVIADQEAIRLINPQRFDMEQLTAIVYLDPVERIFAGYKDVGTDEFWVKGHMPGYPLLPGILMCESAAQMCSYYITTQGLMEKEFLGFGGLERRPLSSAGSPRGSSGADWQRDQNEPQRDIVQRSRIRRLSNGFSRRRSWRSHESRPRGRNVTRKRRLALEELAPNLVETSTEPGVLDPYILFGNDHPLEIRSRLW